MPTARHRFSNYLMFGSVGLLFAGLSALAGAAGLNEKAMVGVGLGLVAAGLSFSLAATQALHMGGDPPNKDPHL